MFKNVERWNREDSKEYLELEKKEEEAAAEIERLKKEVDEAKEQAE